MQNSEQVIKFRPIIFFISFMLGIFVLKFVPREIKIIYMLPNPENLETVYHNEKDGKCFKYSMKEDECQKDKPIRSFFK